MKLKLSIMILLFCSWHLTGQDPYAVSITRTNGLPSNSVYHIFQDSKGFIWLATSEGLSRYDGYEFKSYALENQSSRAGTEIHEDRYGRIWYQNFDGFLFYVTNDSLRKLEQNEPAGYNHFGIAGNRVFVVQKKGVDFYDLKTLIRIKTLPVDISKVGGTHQTDTYFYLFSDHLTRIDSLGTIENYAPSSLTKNELPSLMQKNGDELFMVSLNNHSKNCYYLKEKRIALKFALNPGIQHIHNLSFTDSTYWFCTPKGVYSYKTNGVALAADSGFFRDKSISSVLRDREGNYWFGTTNQGLLFVPNLNSRLFKTKYKSNAIQVVDNTIYIGTKSDEIYQLELATLLSKPFYTGHSNHEIYNMGCDTVNKYLTFTSWGLNLMDLKGKTVFEWSGAVKDFRRIDEKYYAFAASGVIGLLSIHPELKSEWDHFLSYQEKSSSFLNLQLLKGVRGKALAYDEKKKCIYYATSIGLFKVDTLSIKELRYQDKKIHITKLQECAERIFGLDEQGILYELKGEEVKVVYLGSEVSKNGGIKMIKSAGEFLFLCSTEFYCLQPSEKTPLLHKISLAIPVWEISDLAVWKGQLIIATEEGLLFPEFDIRKKDFMNPRFVINGIKVNGKLTESTTTLKLKYSENNIEINYSILCFRNGSEYPLSYKINDQPWKLTSPESRILNLASLAPGTYSLVFRLGNSSEITATLLLDIRRPWWQQYWFILLCFVSVIGAVYGYYKWQLALLRRRNSLLSEKIELEKHLNKSILTSIRSQMNPHFFYNALNTIQSFIFSDDKKNAGAYLSKFSKLTRTILEHSEKEKITLSEEIGAITLYLEIEKVRFNEDFDFTITVHESLDKELVKIPSMLIQPYVENAIRHGLLHKKERKQLSIDFISEDGFLKITIDDNGIGRKRSEELNKIKRKGHQSFAVNANQMRLEILNKESKTKTAVHYTDKIDAENRPAGTTVIIQLPINKYERDV